MIGIRQSLALVLCILQIMPALTSAFLKGSPLKRRFIPKDPSKSRLHPMHGEITFKEELPVVTEVSRHGSVVLECEAQAIPAPTIHWLKNGVRMRQGYSFRVEDDAATYEDHIEDSRKEMIGVSSTKSRLHLDCLNGRDEAKYTCVAESPYLKATQNTTVKVVKRTHKDLNEISQCMGKRRSTRGEPARIHMWTVSRLEYEGIKVQLFCRAEGYPEPTITWYDRDDQPIVKNTQNYRLLNNGDLIVRSISWFENMGVYTCFADNGYGTDSKRTFLYPAARY